MTKAEWLRTLDPLVVLANLKDAPSPRKMRLAAVACCRRIWNLIVDERSKVAVEAAERYADRSICSAEAMAYEEQAMAAVGITREVGQDATNDAASTAAVCLALWARAHWGTFQTFQRTAVAIGRRGQMEILDCVFGIPFRSVAFDPSWLTSTVLALATGIYAEKAFDRLPILADALQDAGCDAEDILDHLRSDTTHVKGCWALDLVLGKS